MRIQAIEIEFSNGEKRTAMIEEVLGAETGNLRVVSVKVFQAREAPGATRAEASTWFDDALASLRAPDADPPMVLGPCRRCGCDHDKHRHGGPTGACVVCGSYKCAWYWP